MATRVTINGTTITSSGRGNVVVIDGRVIVDGQDVTPDAKQVRIEVHGDIQTLEVDSCDTVRVTGSVGEVRTQSGDVHCGNVSGSVSTMSGDVACAAVGGRVSTMSGDIHHAR